MYKKAIILFSGGLDSTTCVAIAKEQGFECYGLTFAYGQKHAVEVAQAKKIASGLGLTEHRVLTLPIGEYGGSALTDASIAVSDYDSVNATADAVPSTYVPARNTIFLSFALSWGEVMGAQDIFIGANCVDYSNYPDCRPDYLAAFEKLASLATKVGIEEGPPFKIHAPLLYLNKADIIRAGLRLGVNYADTISCYRADAEGRACGSCESCNFRRKGFMEAGVADPTRYGSE